jgi:hypothetical protein
MQAAAWWEPYVGGLIENIVYGFLLFLAGQLFYLARLYLREGVGGFQAHLQSLFSNLEFRRDRRTEYYYFILGRVLLTVIVVLPVAVPLSFVIDAILRSDPTLAAIAAQTGKFSPFQFTASVPVPEQNKISTLAFAASMLVCGYTFYRYALWGIPVVGTLFVQAMIVSAFAMGGLTRGLAALLGYATPGELAGLGWVALTAVGLAVVFANTVALATTFFFMPRSWLVWLYGQLGDLQDPDQRGYYVWRLSHLRRPALTGGLLLLGAAALGGGGQVQGAALLGALGGAFLLYVAAHVAFSQLSLLIISSAFVWPPGIVMFALASAAPAGSWLGGNFVIAGLIAIVAGYASLAWLQRVIVTAANTARTPA